MLEPETADLGGFDDVGYHRAQDMAELDRLASSNGGRVIEREASIGP